MPYVDWDTDTQEKRLGMRGENSTFMPLYPTVSKMDFMMIYFQ